MTSKQHPQQGDCMDDLLRSLGGGILGGVVRSLPGNSQKLLWGRRTEKAHKLSQRKLFAPHPKPPLLGPSSKTVDASHFLGKDAKKGTRIKILAGNFVAPQKQGAQKGHVGLQKYSVFILPLAEWNLRDIFRFGHPKPGKRATWKISRRISRHLWQRKTETKFTPHFANSFDFEANPEHR